MYLCNDIRKFIKQIVRIIYTEKSKRISCNFIWKFKNMNSGVHHIFMVYQKNLGVNHSHISFQIYPHQ